MSAFLNRSSIDLFLGLCLHFLGTFSEGAAKDIDAPTTKAMRTGYENSMEKERKNRLLGEESEKIL